MNKTFLPDACVLKNARYPIVTLTCCFGAREAGRVTMTVWSMTVGVTLFLPTETVRFSRRPSFSGSRLNASLPTVFPEVLVTWATLETVSAPAFQPMWAVTSYSAVRPRLFKGWPAWAGDGATAVAPRATDASRLATTTGTSRANLDRRAGGNHPRRPIGPAPTPTAGVVITGSLS